MPQAKIGDTVKVHYSGKLVDGTEFDSSRNREPFKFELGTGQVIPGFEQGIVGMAVGDKKSIQISPNAAYGERDEKLVWQVAKNKLPKELEPQVGQKLVSQTEDGAKIHVLVLEVADNTVTLDANHPLAGEDLIFELELMEIV